MNFLSDILAQSATPGSRWDSTAPVQNVQSAWGGYGQSAPQDVLDYYRGYSPGAALFGGDPSQFGGWYADNQDRDPSKRYYTDKNGFLWIPNVDGATPGGDSASASSGQLTGFRMGNAPGERPGLRKGVDNYYDTSGKYTHTDKDDPGWLNPITGILAVASLGLGAGALAGGAEAAGAAGYGAGEAGGSLASGYGAGSAGAGFGQFGLGAGAGSAGAGYGLAGSTYGGSAIGGGLASGAAGGAAAGSLASEFGGSGGYGFGDVGLGSGSGSGGSGYGFGQGSTFGGSSIGGGLSTEGVGAGTTGLLSDGTNTSAMGNGADVAGTPPPANPYSTASMGSFGKLGGAMDFNWTDLIGPAMQLYSGAQGSKAAENASAAQLTAAREAMALSAPWREKGVGALNKLSVLLGLEGQGDPEFGALTKGYQFTQDDPSYQFRLNQGLKALKNSYAGKGRFLSGSAMKGINDYAQGAASQEFGQAFNRDLATRTNMFNRLASLAGTGQTASNTMGDLNTQAGNAKAAGQIGSANAISNGITGAYNTYTQNEMMRRLLSGGY